MGKGGVDNEQVEKRRMRKRSVRRGRGAAGVTRRRGSSSGRRRSGLCGSHGLAEII